MPRAGSVVDLLSLREHFSMKLGLGRITACMQELGNPQDSFKSIHVAGTNGKGSTCAFIATALQQAGYKVGLYTSPHLIYFHERFQINRKPITNKELDKLYYEFEPVFNKHELTFFEATTVLAFIYFARNKVDYAVVEVGLGGRLDATNIIRPEVTVITDIGFDHMRILGETIGKIAFEKAGIIKEKVPLIVSPDNAGVKTILFVAKQKHAPVIEAPALRKYKLSLFGKFQQRNAGLAFAALRKLSISEGKIKKSFANTYWPGRIQIVDGVVIDGAHNISAMKALCSYLRSTPKKKVIVFGVLADKAYEKMLKEVLACGSKVVLTKPSTSIRAIEPEKLLALVSAKDKKRVFVEASVPGAIRKAKAEAHKIGQAQVVLCGSLYLAGEALDALGKKLY